MLVRETNEVYETELLQPIRNIPRSCSQGVAELNDTLWTQLNNNNEWLYVSPKDDKLTVLCPGQEPTDFEIYGTGKLTFHTSCKEYGDKVFIQAPMIINSNRTEDLSFHPYLLIMTVVC
jgi:hypothetical protein